MTAIDKSYTSVDRLDKDDKSNGEILLDVSATEVSISLFIRYVINW